MARVFISSCDGTNGIPRENRPNYGRVELELRLGIHRRYHRHHEGDYENHLEVLQQVLERLRKYRLRPRREKCSFACKEVKYLGYQVSTVGIAPQCEYLDRIRALPKPKSRDELRA